MEKIDLIEYFIHGLSSINRTLDLIGHDTWHSWKTRPRILSSLPLRERLPQVFCLLDLETYRCNLCGYCVNQRRISSEENLKAVAAFSFVERRWRRTVKSTTEVCNSSFSFLYKIMKIKVVLFSSCFQHVYSILQRL